MDLKDFVPYVPTINIREFFNDPKHTESLRQLIEQNNVVFYRKYRNSFALNQGAYLTEIPSLLYSILEGYIKRSKNTKIQVVREVPIPLLEFEGKALDISIIIGENGTGKSRLLLDLAFEYLEKDKTNVLAISSSIFDRFSNIRKNLKKGKGENFKFLGASNGPKIIENTLKDFLNLEKENIYLDDASKSMINTLFNYLGYDNKIGVRFNPITFINDKISQDNELTSNLSKDINEFNLKIEDGKKIFWIYLSNNSINKSIYDNIKDIYSTFAHRFQ